jgi:hypothetical protein
MQPIARRRAVLRRSLIALGVAALVVGCARPVAQGDDEPSPSVASSPTATPSPTPSSASEPSHTPVPTPWFEIPAGILPPESLAAVTTDSLRIRAEPGLDALVGDTLPAGTVVGISGLFGPTVVDGMDWYSVVYYGDLGGWAAAGSDQEQFLEPVPPRCTEAEPDLAFLTSITAWERLACFGDQSLTIVGTFGCHGICGPASGSFEPAWLAQPADPHLIWVVGTRFDELGLSLPQMGLRERAQSGLELVAEGSILRVTGHFNDPAAASCVLALNRLETFGDEGSGVPVHPLTGELSCREHFVVDAWEVIGADPEFNA